jgi:hypothetical protein
MTDRSTIHAILVAARKRIEDPANWCQEWHFYLADGTPAGWTDLFKESGMLWPSAEERGALLSKVARCCADGAILLQTKSESSQAYVDAADIMKTEARRLYGLDYPDVNDSEDGHAKILNVFDAAISWAAQS